MDSIKAEIKNVNPTISNEMLVVGCFLTFKGEVISEVGRIIADKGQKAEVEEVSKKPGFWGKSSGKWYDEKIYGVKLKGYRSEWLLSAFVETSKSCH